MTPDLFAPDPSTAGAVARIVSPKTELGAYEALWSRERTSFKSLANLVAADEGAVPSDFVPPAQAESFAERALSAVRAARIRHFGIRVRGGAEDYPPRLVEARHRLLLLYFQGFWDLVHTPCIAIAGTREPSEEGGRLAARLARACVADGFTVVSGLARGIDAIAHRTAIAAGGRTIAVLGTPITHAYPAEHHDLQQTIADHHLLVSQIPILDYAHRPMRARARFFPERNATISALSGAGVIVEAGDRSGTLTFARHVLNQKRPLFILEHCFRHEDCQWPHRYAELGAIRVADYDAIKAHLLGAAPAF